MDLAGRPRRLRGGTCALAAIGPQHGARVYHGLGNYCPGIGLRSTVAAARTVRNRPVARLVVARAAGVARIDAAVGFRLRASPERRQRLHRRRGLRGLRGCRTRRHANACPVGRSAGVGARPGRRRSRRPAEPAAASHGLLRDLRRDLDPARALAADLDARHGRGVARTSRRGDRTGHCSFRASCSGRWRSPAREGRLWLPRSAWRLRRYSVLARPERRLASNRR